MIAGSLFHETLPVEGGIEAQPFGCIGFAHLCNLLKVVEKPTLFDTCDRITGRTGVLLELPEKSCTQTCESDRQCMT